MSTSFLASYDNNDIKKKISPIAEICLNELTQTAYFEDNCKTNTFLFVF